MIGRFSLTVAVGLFALVLPLRLASAQVAAPVSPRVTVDHGWTRLTSAAGQDTPAFFTITNAGTTPDTLVSTSCPVARHTVLLDQAGKPIGAIVIKPGQTMVFAPSATHLMLQRNRFRFYAHAMIPCSVDFLDAGKMIVYLHVEPDNAMRYHPARRPVVKD